MRKIKIVIEKHSDGFVAYAVGVKGVVVGEGDTREEAVADVKSAIEFHLKSFSIKLNNKNRPSRLMKKRLVAAGLPRQNLNVCNQKWRHKAAATD
ncbi:MAG: hypothetical protein ACYDA9_05590 [Terriglobia bacterium]